MKTNFRNAGILMMVLLVFLVGCKKDEEETPTLSLTSLTADGIDLAGISSATDVPEDADILAVFSSDVDETTVTIDNFKISLSDGTSLDYSVSVSGSTVTITPTSNWDAGSEFAIVLSSTIKGDNGAFYGGNTLSFRTSGIFVPQSDKQVLYLNFDNQTLIDETEMQTVSELGSVDFTEDRRGTANSAAYFDGEGSIVEVAASADLISASTTISFWFKTDLSDYDGGESTGSPQSRFLMGLGAEKGYFLELGRRSNDPTAEAYNEIYLKSATDHVNIGDNATSVPKATAWTELNSEMSIGYEDGVSSGYNYALDDLLGSNDPLNRDYINNLVMGSWSHFVMTVDAVAQTKTIYINGVKLASFQWLASGAEWLFADLSLKTENNDGTTMEGLEGSLALGFAGSSLNTATGWANYETNLANAAESKKFFKGSLDQFRIFSVALNDSEIVQLYDNEK